MPEKQQMFMLLDAIGNPIAREWFEGSDEANPYIYYQLRLAYQDLEKEIKKQDAVSVVEIITIERIGSGM